MKVAFLVLCLALCAVAEKRGILDSFTDEINKLAKCELSGGQKLCEDCCQNTTWVHPSEGTLCAQACTLLP